MDPQMHQSPTKAPLAGSQDRQRITAATLLVQFHAVRSPSSARPSSKLSSPALSDSPSTFASPPSLVPPLNRLLCFEHNQTARRDQMSPPKLDVFDKAEKSVEAEASTPTPKARGHGSPHTLRSRDTLSLSQKAVANIARGFRDPRSPASLGSSSQKSSPRSRRPILVGDDGLTERERMRRQRDAFLIAHAASFLPVLGEKNYICHLLAGQSQKSTVGDVVDKDTNTAFQTHAVPFEELQQQPAGIKATLKPHQLTGLSFLVWLHKNAASGILGDEMGLGKTLQTLSLLQWAKTANAECTKHVVHLIVAPMSVMDTWMQEATRFTPSLVVSRFHGPPAERERLKAAFRANLRMEQSLDVLVTSYETYERESSWFNKQRVWGWVILDEGHRIKNGESILAHRLNGISSENRLVLTGTPVQNDMFELWSLFRWLYREAFPAKSAEEFKKAFCLGRANGLDIDLVKASRKLLELVMLRRTKTSSQVNLDLPAMTEVRLRVPLTPYQREVYRAHIAGKSDGVLGNKSWTRLLNLLVELRQISIHPSLVADGSSSESHGGPPSLVADDSSCESHGVPPSLIAHSGKFVVLKAILDHHVAQRKEKLIIFSCFVKALDCVEELLAREVFEDSHIDWLRIDGSTPRAKRSLNVRLFQQTNNDYKVMLVSVRSGGTGLTLTAASNVVFLDEDFNPQVTIQACARAHRIGQDKEVSVYKLYAGGTVEEQLLRRVTKKLLLSTKVMEDFENSNLAKGTAGSLAATKELQASLSTSQMMCILKSGLDTLKAPAASLGKMSKWTMRDILEQCRMIFEDSDTEDTSYDDEDISRFFQNRSITDTRLFEGVKHARQVREEPVDDPEPELDRASRRIGKQMTVVVDGYQVSKHSQACADGEAVATLAGRNPSLRGRTRAARAEFGHELECCFCGKTPADDDRKDCADCPRAMHPSCLAAEATRAETRAFPGQSRCPGHECSKCHVKTAEAGGLLYRCVHCVRAYCETHLVWERAELKGYRLAEWEDRGFGEKDSIFYIKCEECVRPLKRKASDALAKGSDSVTAAKT